MPYSHLLSKAQFETSIGQQVKFWTMKKALQILTLAAIFLTNQSFSTPFPKESGFRSSTVKAAKETVILTAGTPVSFKLSQNVNSDNVEIGNTVLMITDDVVVASGQIVIRQGERAEGTVTDIRRKNDCARCPDKSQRLEISIERVKAIDGQYVMLFGAPLTARSKCAKCSVELNTSVRLAANVQSNTVVTTR